eukprot:CAMPEP_0170415496 /NCGR_PEP_ID=MMETSP0117_2-20130122/32641_1 /TAXON_ID=400756 /ORGANISM="Durinskia baltica, Strain CSIRO CS-38" /LENGTH=556 /DNA_ID=CAMNT_0010673473 /DNA_START=61 /DNA_END=1731 /DNA_ORIENTATION=-
MSLACHGALNAGSCEHGCLDFTPISTSEDGRHTCICGHSRIRHAATATGQAVPVEKEGDPIIEGIYERLSENRSEPEVNTFVMFGDLKLLVRQEWIDLKNDVLAERPDKHHKTIFLRGTSGRGKSSFVYYLMYCIMIGARKAEQESEQESEPANRSKKRKAEQESGHVVVGYVRNEGSAEVKFLLTLSGVKRVASIPSSVHYYIADIKGDQNRTNLAQRFTMVVASDDAGKAEFRKRVEEAGRTRSGYTKYMPSPTTEEMHSIFKDTLSTEEINFRLGVVGRNPRKLGTEWDTYKPNPDFEGLVKETCAEILGCAETDKDPAHFNWVMGVVMQSIDTATVLENKITMTSLFREDILMDITWISVFTSTFMCFLAGRIRDKFTYDTLGYLTLLFGRSGVGNCHEYDSHNFFCALISTTHPCWCSTTKQWVNVQLGAGPRQKVIFRNINSIADALQNSESVARRYLLPSITNLALIDSIIPNDIVLQMTVSDKHRGATKRMAEIREELGKPNTVRMIFVVPEDVVTKFTFPADMPLYVKMYVTVAKNMDLADAMKLKR